MEERELRRRAAEALDRLQRTRPLVHHLTNLVIMADTANATLHVGASPVMAHAREEVEEMASIADAIVLNIGTLEPDWVEAMILAGKKGRERGVPVILDPVGAGATSYRTAVAHRILKEVGPAIVRGNAGEIGTLAGAGGEVKGVDSLGGLENPGEVAQEAAARWDCVVAITGRQDYVADADRRLAVDNGHAWLTTITGTGCMATAVIGAFAAVGPDPVVAAASALACFGVAAELASEQCAGPGFFKSELFDALFNLTPERLAEGLRLAGPGSGDSSGVKASRQLAALVMGMSGPLRMKPIIGPPSTSL